MEETEAQDLPSPVRLAFQVAYFGGHFMGSQLQPELRTVEGELIAACTRLGLFTDWRDAGFATSGRTDRGVHALGQVMAFTTEHPGRAIETLNIQLPPDLWCVGYSPVSPGFHPRYDARWRTYRYYFREEGLDLETMKAGAALFEGVHDFSGFAKVSDKNPVRGILSASLGLECGIVYFEVTAQSSSGTWSGAWQRPWKRQGPAAAKSGRSNKDSVVSMKKAFSLPLLRDSYYGT